ncbi:hypothetical protein TALC_01346 [Thermoplasmatales archaeon BRNA1]|nr:hypothetical protein TALC_01346 [Thermoplasmatales archaeon BRNA1]
MDPIVAYCGLDCSKCKARIATVNDDDEMRSKIAEEWSRLNNVEITPDMVNCDGCRMNGRKTVYCESLCPIRQCAMAKGYATCAECSEMADCEKVGMIFSNAPEARDNLAHLNIR